MRDYQDIRRFKKRVRALVGPRPASQRVNSIIPDQTNQQQHYYSSDFCKVA
jgi:hypothetical protein